MKHAKQMELIYEENSMTKEVKLRGIKNMLISRGYVDIEINKSNIDIYHTGMNEEFDNYCYALLNYFCAPYFRNNIKKTQYLFDAMVQRPKNRKHLTCSYFSNNTFIYKDIAIKYLYTKEEFNELVKTFKKGGREVRYILNEFDKEHNIKEFYENNTDDFYKILEESDRTTLSSFIKKLQKYKNSWQYKTIKI